ncbi:ABC transporter [Jeotgalibacillus alimentarius]|uniref:ABC transporter n=1 Tax=Jeotgalibacillus alimentarius TaxID=135826 RepID=A0A0C2VFK5_9BACL|nr:ABC transporter ATP-binding protein [Jeotgalibacillus alimentarius]KIL42798.1 ABC transporter [Jeotgalibacillus alimentarius]
MMELKQIEKSFSAGEVSEQVLKGVTLTIESGKLTALTGVSGSGKSTLLSIAAGLQSTTSGSVLFDGRDLTSLDQEELRALRAGSFGFVFQSSHLVPFLTAAEQLELMLKTSGRKLSKKAAAAEISRVLTRVGMEHRRNAYPDTMSGGEKQRIAIARALIHQPKIVFADEPTASLDSKRSHDIMKLLKDITTDTGTAVLMVTHDEEMLGYADRVVEMRDGLIG